MNIDRKRRENSRKPCRIDTLFTENTTWTALGVNSALHFDSLATDPLEL